jgi:hypothetical protein
MEFGLICALRLDTNNVTSGIRADVTAILVECPCVATICLSFLSALVNNAYMKIHNQIAT